MLKLASDPKNVARVESFVEHLVDKYGISPDVYGNILISLTEAVTNAIIHGNDNDETKTVQVRLKKQKNKLAFLISDEGGGFDFDNLPDPTAPENLVKKILNFDYSEAEPSEHPPKFFRPKGSEIGFFEQRRFFKATFF
jgi:serine/threonine-protein kinase RsbW